MLFPSCWPLAPPPTSPSFFFNDPATTEISPLPLHDALPICFSVQRRTSVRRRERALELLHFKQARGEAILWRRHSCLQRRDESRRWRQECLRHKIASPRACLKCRSSSARSRRRTEVRRCTLKQIGRASCRGRGEISVVAGSLKKKEG